MELEDVLKIQINKYLNNELSGEELSKFETLLSNDGALRKLVAFYKDLDDTITADANSQKDFDKIADLLNDLGDEYIIEEAKVEEAIPNSTTKAKATINSIRYLIPLATAAAVLLFVTTLFTSSEDTKKLANTYYQTYEVNFTTKSAATDLSNAEELYNNKKWAAARDLFNRHPKNIKAQIAVANCEYQLQKYNDAIETLKPIANNKTDYSDTANWYLAMNYLQKENKNEASNTLKNITADSRFYDKAQDIIEEL